MSTNLSTEAKDKILRHIQEECNLRHVIEVEDDGHPNPLTWIYVGTSPEELMADLIYKTEAEAISEDPEGFRYIDLHIISRYPDEAGHMGHYAFRCSMKNEAVPPVVNYITEIMKSCDQNEIRYYTMTVA